MTNLTNEAFTKTIKDYLGAVTKLENTSNLAGRDIRIAYSQGNLETFLNPIVVKLDGSKYPEKVKALRSMIMANTDNKVTLGRLEDKGFEVSQATQTRQRDIKASSIEKQLEAIQEKLPKCSTLSLEEQANISEYMRLAQNILKVNDNAQKDAKKNANKNGK